MTGRFTAELEPMFGMNVEMPNVKALLESLGATGKLEIDPADGSAYISRPKLGFTLLLKDPSRIKNPRYSILLKHLPILTTCFYYSEGHEGYSEFKGALPGDLNFTDSHDEIVEKLGQPYWKREKNGKTVSEKWEIGDLSVHATYRKELEGILILAFGIKQNF